MTVSPPWRIEPPDDLEAHELTVDGHVYVLLSWSSRALSSADRRAGLTTAERGVLAGILRGESNAAIARGRGSRPRTVANQVASLFRKLGVRSRLELVTRAVRGPLCREPHSTR
jgi:DNA-binding NarL/FixJ family response regulator